MFVCSPIFGWSFLIIREVYFQRRFWSLLNLCVSRVLLGEPPRVRRWGSFSLPGSSRIFLPCISSEPPWPVSVSASFQCDDRACVLEVDYPDPSVFRGLLKAALMLEGLVLGSGFYRRQWSRGVSQE